MRISLDNEKSDEVEIIMGFEIQHLNVASTDLVNSDTDLAP